MVADGGASVGITTEAFRSGLPDHPWLTVAELDCAERWGETVSTSELVQAPRLDDLAYLIFTSGSTGRPKAVGFRMRGGGTGCGVGGTYWSTDRSGVGAGVACGLTEF